MRILFTVLSSIIFFYSGFLSASVSSKYAKSSNLTPKALTKIEVEIKNNTKVLQEVKTEILALDKKMQPEILNTIKTKIFGTNDEKIHALNEKYRLLKAERQKLNEQRVR